MLPMFEPVIGMEVHIELSTNSKLFCGCPNLYGEPPNTLCCPVCMGLPGALPVFNRRAVDYALRIGAALHCNIHNVSEFDRKHYFYPDLPKGYQITQQLYPLCTGGYLEYRKEGKTKKVRINRIHIEEDAGKLLHDEQRGTTMVDYNRCGVPLIEIVTEPDMHSPQDARLVLEAIAQSARYLGISHARMHEGNIRADVNISIRDLNGNADGERIELKNINSGSAVFDAVTYEVRRQTQLLKTGGALFTQTRRWDAVKRKSMEMRGKEKLEEYAYYADEDLENIVITSNAIREATMCECVTPLQKMLDIMNRYSIAEEQAKMLCDDESLLSFFEEVMTQGTISGAAAVKWMVGPLFELLHESDVAPDETMLSPQAFSQLIALVSEGELSYTAGKAVLKELAEKGGWPKEIMQRQGLRQMDDDAQLAGIVQYVLDENKRAVEDYCNGKDNALDFLAGRCMKKSGGRANPAAIKRMLTDMLCRDAKVQPESIV